MPPGSSRLHCCPEGLGLAIDFSAPHCVKGNQGHSIPVGGHGPPQEADISRFYSCPRNVQRRQHHGPGDAGALGHGAVSTPTTPPGIRVCVLSLSCHARLRFQAPLSMEFSRQEYWSGRPYSPARDLPDPGVEPRSLTSSALAGRFLTSSATREVNAIRQGTFLCFESLYQMVQD